jgi:hypothetical protein
MKTAALIPFQWWLPPNIPISNQDTSVGPLE